MLNVNKNVNVYRYNMWVFFVIHVDVNDKQRSCHTPRVYRVHPTGYVLNYFVTSIRDPFRNTRSSDTGSLR